MARPPVFVALAASALAVQLVAAGIVALAYGAAYGPSPWMAEGTAVGLSYVMLGVAGIVGGALALGGAYLAILRARASVAIAVVVLLSAPAVLVATVALYGLLVLLTLI